MWAGGSQLVLGTQRLSGPLILACWGLSHGMPQENGSKASQTSRPLILHSRSSNMVWVPDRGRSLFALSVSAYQLEYQRWIMHIPSNPWLEPLIGRYETSNVKGGITSSFHRLSYPSRTIGTPWVSSGAWQMGAQGIQRIPKMLFSDIVFQSGPFGSHITHITFQGSQTNFKVSCIFSPRRRNLTREPMIFCDGSRAHSLGSQHLDKNNLLRLHGAPMCP
jgi:hypothetical protein